MHKDAVVSNLKDFWHELDDSRCKNIVDKWNSDNVWDIASIIQSLYPHLDMVDEFIMQLEDIEYAEIKLPKYTTINGIPNINNYEKEGNEYKLNSFYKELRDKLQNAPEDQFTLDFVIQAIFTHFITKFNNNVADFNKYKEEVERYKEEVGQYREAANSYINTTSAFINNYGLLKTPEERNKEWFTQVFSYMPHDSGIPREHSGFVYIAKQMNEVDVYKIGMTSNLENREKAFKTGNIYIQIIASVPHNFPSKLENSLHKSYQNKNLAGEWFRFTNEELLDIIETYGFMLAIQD